MFKNKTLVAAMTTMLIFSAPFNVRAQTVNTEAKLTYQPENEIAHAIGVYITNQGQKKIFNGIPTLLERNGLSISQAYFHKQKFEMEEKSLEQMLPPEGALRDAALKIKETIQRYLMGLDLNDHKFVIDFEGIEVEIDWNDVRVEIDEIARDEGKLKLKLILEAKGLDIAIAKLRAQDLNNDIIGSIGVDDFSLFVAEDSSPLNIEIPIILENTTTNRGPNLIIGNLSSNFDSVLLGAEIKGAVTLPEIELRINGRVIRANYTELENMLKTNQERIVQAIQSSLHGFLAEDAAPMINELFVVERNNEGLFHDVNVMSPAGAPLDQIVSPFEWGIKLKKYDFLGDTVHLTLDGYFKDMVKGRTAFPSSMQASGQPLGNVSSQNDFVLSINEGFINRIVQLSYNRGYFNSFKTEDGEEYVISKIPHFKLKNSNDRKPSRLSVELKYNVTGMGAALVKNPIRINFDMLLDFPVEDGKVKIIATEIDMDSVHVDKKYIREFLGLMSWSGVVMPQVRKRFKAAQNDVRGMILADEFPIPESMVGMPLKVMDTSLDPNGHLMIHIDTDLN